MRKACIDDEKSIALEYAVARTALYRKGYAVELLANFNPKLHLSPSGGNSFTARVKGKQTKVSSRQVLIYNRFAFHGAVYPARGAHVDGNRNLCGKPHYQVQIPRMPLIWIS